MLERNNKMWKMAQIPPGIHLNHHGNNAALNKNKLACKQISVQSETRVKKFAEIFNHTKIMLMGKNKADGCEYFFGVATQPFHFNAVKKIKMNTDNDKQKFDLNPRWVRREM